MLDLKVYEYSVEPGKTFVPETLLHILELASKERELVGEVFLTKETVNVWVNSIFDDPAELVLIAFVSPEEGKFRPIKALGGQADSDWEALKKEVSFISSKRQRTRRVSSVGRVCPLYFILGVLYMTFQEALKQVELYFHQGCYSVEIIQDSFDPNVFSVRAK